MSDVPSFKNSSEEADYWKKKALEYKNLLEETRDELEEFQTSSRELEAELEAQLEQQETRCSDLRQQVNRLAIDNQSLKERLEKEQSEFCGELNQLQVELRDIKSNKENLIRYVRQLEQTNDDLERAKRATVTSLEDFEVRLNQAIERNAFLESELDEKEALKEMVQRLKDEARDLRQEVVITKKRTDPEPDNNKALQINCKLLSNSKQPHSPITQIDSNKLACDSPVNETCPKTPTKCQNIHNLNNGGVPITPSGRISALNIVGDLLRKVGMKIQQLNKELNGATILTDPKTS